VYPAIFRPHPGGGTTLQRVQRQALTVLFAVLAAALAAVSVYALSGGASARQLIVGIAAAAIAAWLATLSASAFRRRR
jgi:hypothetical protein